MIAKPLYVWSPEGSINRDGTISLCVDIEMLESIKQTMRSTIKDYAERYKYEDLKEVVDDYLKIEHLTILYNMREEGETDDNVSEEQD